MRIKLIRLILFGIVLLLVMMTVGIGSSEKINVQQVGSFGSDREIGDIEVVGNYAYVLQLGDLVVLSVTDPTNPVEVSRITPPTNTGFGSITSSEKYIYVAASDYSIGTTLMIYDINNPTTPKLVGQYNNPDSTEIIEVSNDYAYLLSYGKGCFILDVSNPVSPQLVGQYILNDITNLDVSDQYLHLVAGHYLTGNSQTGSFMVLDISNPSEPKLVGQYTNSYIFNDVAVSGQYAYLANGANGLIVLDISNPTIPQLVGKLSVTGSDTEQVAISAKYAYVLNSDSDVYSLEIANIANPKVPTLVDQDYYTSYPEDPVEHYSAFDGCGIGAVSGNYIYMIPEYGGLAILKTEIQDDGPTEGSLVQVQGSSDVYLIENGMKCHFTSPEALEWNGYSFNNVIQVSSGSLDSIQNGADISITQVIIDKYHALGGSPIFGQPMGTGELNGAPDSAGNYCSYVNFQNGAIDCFKNGPHAGEAYAIFNPLCTKWGQLGYGAGTLGYPIEAMSEPQTSKYGTSFRYQNFTNGDQRGALEYNINSGKVVEIHGAIFAKWAETGFASGILGLVTEDENTAAVSPFTTVGKYSKFENGTIHWISNKVGENEGHAYRGQSFITSGGLDAFYTSMGGTGGDLGFPVMDQRTVGVYGYCEFEGGKIEWDDIDGTYKMIITEKNSFSPSLNGYKFDNIVGKEYSWDQFCRTYDYNGAQYAATVYLDNNEPYQVPTREYYFFQHHYKDVGKTGTCFGMSASSLVLYNSGLGAWDYWETDTLPTIWHGIGPFVFGYSPETVQEWVEYYQPLQNDKACVEDVSKYKDLKDNYNTLKLRLASNDFMVLGFYYGPDNVDNPPGHAVVPYRIIESLDHKIGHIYVYDCNHPYNPDNSLDHIKCIDIDLEKWEVKDYDGCNNMRDVALLSLTAIAEKPEIPDNIVGLDSPLNANLLFTDSFGRHVGYDQGVFKDEIPGTCSMTCYNDQEITSNLILESYYVPDTSLKTELYGVGSGASNVSMITPNGLIIVNVPLSSQSIDEFKVLNEGTGIEFKSQNSTTPSINIILNVETEDHLQIVVANISQIEKSSVIALSNVNGDIVIKNIGQPKTFSLNLGQSAVNPNSGHASKNVVIEENSTIHIKSVNWNSISNSNITVEHDVGSDSTIEYTESVQMKSSTDSGSKSGGGGGSSGSSSNSKSSSGGGGGGAGSAEDYSNVAMKDVDSQYLRMNANITYEFTKEGNPIQSVSFYSLKNSGEITSTIEVLNNRSKLVNSTPEGSIYKYVNIWVGKSGFATAANIKDAKVMFKVNNSWLQDMGLRPADVKLQRYNRTAWEVLPTTIANNTTGYVIFETQTPGFSPFAITAEKVLSSSTGDNMDVKFTQEEDVGMNGTQPEKTPGFGFSMAILIIGVVAGGYVYLKRRQN